MITQLIADAAAGVSPEVVGGIIVAVLGASGGWYAKGRLSSQSDSDLSLIHI